MLFIYVIYVCLRIVMVNCLDYMGNMSYKRQGMLTFAST